MSPNGYSAKRISALLNATVNVMQNGVTISDLTQPDKPLIYVNAGFEALTGYTAAEVIGRNCRFLQGEEHNQEAIPIMRKAMAAGQPCRVIVRNYRKEGPPFWNELSLYPLFADDETLTHYVGIQYDITEIVERSKRLIQAERKAAQDAARHAQSMTVLLEQLHNTQAQLIAAEKMASLGRLVAGLAHEINTPIGIAVTAASIAEDRTAELGQLYQNGRLQRSDLEEFLQTITESGRLIANNLNRAAALIQSFKQVAVDQSSEAVRTINLKTYMTEVVASLQPELKRTRLLVAVSGDEDLVLQSYPGALSQIMTNLIVNSITHAYAPDADGHLTITIGQQNDKACLTYGDDGKGIPTEDQGKIFEPFFTTRRGRGGSGLGLHIVYNLVTQKLGGTIGFQSQVGAGTTFKILLPLQV